MKKIHLILAALVLGTGISMAASLSESLKENHVAPVGSVSLGFTFNPASLGSQLKVQPKAGEFAKPFLLDDVKNRQMFMLSQDPVVALRMKYRAKEHLNIRFSVGFSGSHVNYSEYVMDDEAEYKIMKQTGGKQHTQNKVADVVKSNMGTGNFALGFEYTTGTGNLQFTAGISLLYALGGGKTTMEYGNAYHKDYNNNTPTTVPFLKKPGEGSMNEWEALTPYDTKLGLANARPKEVNTKGINHGFGPQVDMGIEWYFMEHVSLSASVVFTPVMFVVQPQTYATYEGYSTDQSKVIEHDLLYSPGSWMCLYGLNNLGCQLGLNYYF